MKDLSWFALIVLALAGAAQSWGAEYVVDGAHSNAGFSIRHLVSRVPGSFQEVEGKITFEGTKFSGGKGEFKAKAKSINTNNAKRDEHLRGADFFDATKYPEITLKNAVFKPRGDNRYKLEGDLTLKGVTKRAVFDAEYLGVQDDPWGKKRAGFSVTGKINRKDYGMTWNKALDQGGMVLGDEVEIRFDIEAVAAE